MLYRKLIRPLLLSAPAFILAGSLLVGGKALATQDTPAFHRAIESAAVLAPGSAIISLALVYEIDSGRELQRYLRKNPPKRSHRGTV